jgi:anti-sigma factor RsiW
MQCTDAREFVSAFVDGELAGEVQQRAGAHIATCSACSKLADDYRDIGRHIASGYEPPASDLADKIRKSIDSESAATASVQQRGLHSLLRQAAVFILACGLSALAG